MIVYDLQRVVVESEGLHQEDIEEFCPFLSQRPLYRFRENLPESYKDNDISFLQITAKGGETTKHSN